MMPLCRSLLAVAFATAIVSGQIRDRTTNQPMPGLRVAVGAHQARTDRDGRYTVKGVAAGATMLVVQSKDVPAQRFSITIKAPSTRFNVRVCSMTLDYSCSSLNGSPNSD